MYAGRIVEIAPCDVIMRNPVHPYTKKLLAGRTTPNLDHPLDFAAIGKPSSESRKNWARQFQEETPGDLAHADLGQGHLVLARRNVDVPGAAPMIKRRHFLGLMAGAMVPWPALAEYKDSDFLKAVEKAPPLPPVAERLPKNPRVVRLAELGKLPAAMEALFAC